MLAPRIRFGSTSPHCATVRNDSPSASAGLPIGLTEMISPILRNLAFCVAVRGLFTPEFTPEDIWEKTVTNQPMQQTSTSTRGTFCKKAFDFPTTERVALHTVAAGRNSRDHSPHCRSGVYAM